MKHLKTFEQNINETEPKIVDYVVLNFDNNAKGFSIRNILQKIIGQIIEVYRKNPKEGEQNTYLVKFGTTEWIINRKEIADFSKNKEDLEYIITANKYNI